MNAKESKWLQESLHDPPNRHLLLKPPKQHDHQPHLLHRLCKLRQQLHHHGNDMAAVDDNNNDDFLWLPPGFQIPPPMPKPIPRMAKLNLNCPPSLQDIDNSTAWGNLTDGFKPNTNGSGEVWWGLKGEDGSGGAAKDLLEDNLDNYTYPGIYAYYEYYDYDQGDWLAKHLDELYEMMRSSQTDINIALTIFLAIVFVFGVTGNLLVLAVFSRGLGKQQASTVFIKALAVTDLIICLVVLPGVLLKEWYIPYRWDAVCQGWELIRCSTIPLSTLILVSVAVDRYVKICRVARTLHISTTTAKKILLAAAVVSVCLGIPPMLRVGVYQAGNGPDNHKVYLGLCMGNDLLVSKETVDRYWQLMAAKFLLVLVIVMVMYGMVFRTVYKQCRRWGRGRRRGGDKVTLKDDQSGRESGVRCGGDGHGGVCDGDQSKARRPGKESGARCSGCGDNGGVCDGDKAEDARPGTEGGVRRGGHYHDDGEDNNCDERPRTVPADNHSDKNVVTGVRDTEPGFGRKYGLRCGDDGGDNCDEGPQTVAVDNHSDKIAFVGDCQTVPIFRSLDKGNSNQFHSDKVRQEHEDVRQSGIQQINKGQATSRMPAHGRWVEKMEDRETAPSKQINTEVLRDRTGNRRVQKTLLSKKRNALSLSFLCKTNDVDRGATPENDEQDDGVTSLDDGHVSYINSASSSDKSTAKKMKAKWHPSIFSCTSQCTVVRSAHIRQSYYRTDSVTNEVADAEAGIKPITKMPQWLRKWKILVMDVLFKTAAQREEDRRSARKLTHRQNAKIKMMNQEASSCSRSDVNGNTLHSYHVTNLVSTTEDTKVTNMASTTILQKDLVISNLDHDVMTGLVSVNNNTARQDTIITKERDAFKLLETQAEMMKYVEKTTKSANRNPRQSVVNFAEDVQTQKTASQGEDSGTNKAANRELWDLTLLCDFKEWKRKMANSTNAQDEWGHPNQIQEIQGKMPDTKVTNAQMSVQSNTDGEFPVLVNKWTDYNIKQNLPGRQNDQDKQTTSNDFPLKTSLQAWPSNNIYRDEMTTLSATDMDSDRGHHKTLLQSVSCPLSKIVRSNGHHKIHPLNSPLFSSSDSNIKLSQSSSCTDKDWILNPQRQGSTKDMTDIIDQETFQLWKAYMLKSKVMYKTDTSIPHEKKTLKPIHKSTNDKQTRKNSNDSCFGEDDPTSTPNLELNGKNPQPQHHHHQQQQQQPNEQSHHQPQQPSSPQPNKHCQKPNEGPHHRYSRAQVKTAKVLLLVTVVYVLSFAPVLLMSVGAVPSHPIPFYGYFIHSAANPLLYSFINKAFRSQLYQLICPCCVKG